MHYILLNGDNEDNRRLITLQLTMKLPNAATENLNGVFKHMFSTALATPWIKLADSQDLPILNGFSAINAIRQIRSRVRGIFGPDATARWLEYRINKRTDDIQYVIVPDVLFGEEYHYFRSLQKAKTTMVRIPSSGSFVPIHAHDFEIVGDSIVSQVATLIERLKNV